MEKIFVNNFFSLKLSETYAKEFHKNQSKKKTFISKGSIPLSPSQKAPPPGPECFWIESSSPTGYRVSLVNESESGSQRAVSNIQIH